LLSHSLGKSQLIQHQPLSKTIPQALFLQKLGDLIDGLDIPDRDDLLVLDLAASGNLVDCGMMEGTFAAACNLYKRLAMDSTSCVNNYQVRD
jgi:hypothetical protein